MANPNIFSAYLQPVRSVQDYAADLDRRDLTALQLEGQRGLNALNQVTRQQTMETAQQGMRDRNLLQQLASQAGGDPMKLVQGIRSAGVASILPHADTIEAGYLNRREKEAKIAQEGATTRKTNEDTDAASKVRMLQQVYALPSREDAIAYLGTKVQPGGVGMQEHGLLTRMIQTDPDWRTRLAQMIVTPEKAAEMLRPHMQDTGGSFVDLNPLTKAQPLVKTNTPDALLQAETSRGNNAATVQAARENAGGMRAQAQATRDAASIQTGFANETSLRKEFEGLPEVKNYKQAYPAYAAIKDATQRNTTQSDINIVYGLAKLYDPTSVVREGEYATVANSPNIPERIKGYAQYLAGGGKLSPETKKQILAEAEGRIGTYRAEADKARVSYEGIAKQRGMNPAAVFQAMGDAPAGPTAAPPNAPAPRKVVKFGSLKD